MWCPTVAKRVDSDHVSLKIISVIDLVLLLSSPSDHFDSQRINCILEKLLRMQNLH